MSDRPATPTLSLRAALARELHRLNMIESFVDYAKVVEMLQQRSPKDEILQLPHLKRWSKAHAWLQERLADEVHP